MRDTVTLETAVDQTKVQAVTTEAYAYHSIKTTFAYVRYSTVVRIAIGVKLHRCIFLISTIDTK